MIIWFALCIPILSSLVLLIWFRHRTVWWEYLLPFIVSFLFVGLGKWLGGSLRTTDTEYWTDYAVKGQYYEDWSELVTYTETESDGRGGTRVVVKTRVDYHPPEWVVTDSSGNRLGTSQSHYKALCDQFGNQEYKGVVPRFASVIKPGGLYETTWDGKDSSLAVLSTTHWYKNKVKASQSVFGFRTVSEEDKQLYGLFDYPTQNGYSCLMLLGWTDPQAERLLQLHNAKLGPKYQIRIWILVFNDNDISAAYEQENYWQGGNKNELVVCVGVNQGVVSWGHCFSWTEREQFKAQIKQLVVDQIGQPFQPLKLVQQVATLVPEGWQRKSFADFDYLTVEPPTWFIVIVYLLTLGVSSGCVIFAIRNDINPQK